MAPVSGPNRGYHICDPYVDEVRLRLAQVNGSYRVPVSLPSTGSIITPYSLEVAKGTISGVSVLEKFGRNEDIDTSSDPEDVWNGGGLYTGFPTGSAETLEVFSSNSNDSSSGTGARSVRLYGQLNGVEQIEDVTLNGTTPVTTTNTWTRCPRLRVWTAGSSGWNEGEITVRHSTTTSNVFVVVRAQTNRSEVCALTIPAGKTAYISHVDTRLTRASGGLGSATVSIMVRENGMLFEERYALELNTGGNPPLTLNHALVLPALTDMVIRVLQVSDNNSLVTGQIFGVYVDD